MIQIFNNPIYRVIWTSLFIYIVSTSLTMLAVFEIMHEIYGKEIAVSYWYAISYMVPVIMTYPISIIIDKYDQRKIYFMSIAPVTLLTTLYILAYYLKMIWIVYIACFFIYTLTAISEPVLTSYMSKVISEDNLIHANAVTTITVNVCNILMQAVAGVTVSYCGPIISILIAIGLELLCLCVQSSLWWYHKFDDMYEMSEGNLDTIVNDAIPHTSLFKDGVRYIWTHGLILLLIVMKSIVGLGIGVVYNLNFYYAFFTMTHFDSAELTYAVVTIPTSIFSIIMILLTNRYVKNEYIKMLYMLVICTIMSSIGLTLYFFATNMYMWIGADCLTIGPQFTLSYIVTTIIQKIVPHEYQGRVNSIEFNTRSLCTGITIVVTGIIITYWSKYFYVYRIVVSSLSAISIPVSIYIYKNYKQEDTIIEHDYLPVIY